MLYALALTAVLHGVPVSADPNAVRMLVSIGDNVGDPDDVPLRYATQDAERLRNLMVEIGQVSSDRAYLSLNATAPAVRERFAELTGSVAEVARGGKSVQLLVYVSSHAAAGELHLQGTRLKLTELRRLAEETHARVRVLVLDACDSGAAARTKGAKLGPEYEVRLERLPLTGTVVMTSSGAAEASQEWDALGGSLFTHHLMTGLRGDADADGNGEVTLSEAYDYAYRRTLAGGGARGQHPAFDFDLTGAGMLVLSSPGRSGSTVVFPAPLSGHYLLTSEPRPEVAAEIDKAPGRELRLAVPAGRYLVRKPMGSVVGLVSLVLPYGGEAIVDEAQMVNRHFAEVALKGGEVELHPWSLLALGSLATPPFPSTGVFWQGGLGVRFTAGALSVQAGLAYGALNFQNDSLKSHADLATAELAAAYRWMLNPIVPRLGIVAVATGVREHQVRLNQAALDASLGAGPIPDAQALGLAAGPLVGAELVLNRSFFLDVSAAALVRNLPVEDKSPWSFGFQGQAGVGCVF